MDDAPLSREKVQAACELLFGKGIMNADDLRAKTNPMVLKAVFRRRAREVHPDRAEVLHVSPAVLHEKFTSVEAAYKLIERVVVQGEMFGEEKPAARVRFLEHLVRTGRISRDTMVDALRWQRRQRPSVGRLAVEAGFLTDDQVWEVLHERRRTQAFGERFVEFACRKGYLSSEAAQAVVKKQEKMHRRIGEYFVERRLFDADAVAMFAVEQRRAAVG